MRNLKKFLALVLAMLMVVSAAATVSAFDDVTEEHDFYVAIQDLVGKEIVKGVDENTFNPEGDVTRLQAAIMFARAITGDVGDDAVWNKGLSMFSDVESYQYAVTVAVNAGIINGMGDGTYNPAGNIQFIQALKMAVCALGYGEGLTWGADGMEYYNVAVDKGLTAGLDYIAEATKPLNRGEFAQLIYNMIYADLADGTGSIAYNVFKIGYVEPVEPEPVVEITNFIITATSKQTAYENMEITEEGWVGMQEIADGVTVGETIYFPTADLGLAEGETEDDYFLHVFDVENFDAETEEYDAIAPNALADSWVILAKDITVGTLGTKYNYFTYQGENDVVAKRYYASDVQTGDKVKNEVVIYNMTDFGYNEGKELYVNSKDQVLDPANGEVVLEKVTSSRGNVRYYVLVKETPNGHKQGEYLTYEEAVSAYGYNTGNEAVQAPYSIMDVTDLGSTYALTAFDDNGDGEMDRAYWTPVHVSKIAEKVKDTVGAFNGDDKVVIDGYAKDDIIVYTYNKQLHEVTVLNSANEGTGYVASVNTTKKSVKDNWYSTITLTDGTVLTVYNEQKYTDDQIAAKFGAKNSGKIEFAHDDFVTGLAKGTYVQYTEIDGIVYTIKSVDLEDGAPRVVFLEVTDADFDAVYADVYNESGELEEIAITSLYVNGKNYELANVNWIRLSRLLEEIASEENAGNVYKVLKVEGGYRLSVALDYTGDLTETTADDAAKFKLYELPTTGLKSITIKDNVVVADGDVITKAGRLHTDDETVWFFIDDKANTVKKYQGDVDFGVIELKDTVILANKIGYTGDNKGVADVVYVFNAKSVTGFGGRDIASSIVYMTGIDVADDWYDYYDMGSADFVGLDEDKYTEATYYVYDKDYAVDMYTGKSVVVYSDSELLNNAWYEVDENNVVINADEPVAWFEDKDGDGTATFYTDGTIKAVDFNYAGIKLYDVAEIDGVLNDDWCVDTLKALTMNALSSKVVTDTWSTTNIKPLFYNNSDAKVDTVKTVYVLSGYEKATNDIDADGTFFMVVGNAPVENTLYTYKVVVKKPATAADPVGSFTYTNAADLEAVTVENFTFNANTTAGWARAYYVNVKLTGTDYTVVETVDGTVKTLTFTHKDYDANAGKAGEINASWWATAATTTEYDAIANINTNDNLINGETVVLYNSRLGMGKTALDVNKNTDTAIADTVDAIRVQHRLNSYSKYTDIQTFAYDVRIDWTEGSFTFSIYDTETGKLMVMDPGQYVLDMTLTNTDQNAQFVVRVDFIVK